MSPSMSLERDDQGHDRHSPAPKPVAERLPFGRAVMARMGGGWKWLLSKETGRPCAPSLTRRRCDSTPRPNGYLPAASTFANARAVATKCNIRHRRIVICVVFLSPSRRLRRPRPHLSRAPPTYRRFPCNRAKNIRDNIRYKRVGPRPIIYIRREYNTVRPHSACGGFPPAPEAIKPSPWFLRMPVLHGPPQVLGLT